MRENGSAIMAEVAARNGLTTKALIDKTTCRSGSLVRHEAMYQIYIRCPHLSAVAIGRLLGGRDHTTILHGIEAHCKRIGVSYAQTRDYRHKDRLLAPHVFHAFGAVMKRAA